VIERCEQTLRGHAPYKSPFDAGIDEVILGLKSGRVRLQKTYLNQVEQFWIAP